MDQNRRTFTMQMAGVAAAAAAGIGTAEAAEHHHEAMMSAPSADGWNLAADTRFRCGTCQFWGGMRKISGDKKQVNAVSLGWCNNPASPNYQELTSAVHEMNKPGVWTKWGALT
jgi:anaerobic selenocysteine-containing dehydrogenase